MGTLSFNILNKPAPDGKRKPVVERLAALQYLDLEADVSMSEGEDDAELEEDGFIVNPESSGNFRIIFSPIFVLIVCIQIANMNLWKKWLLTLLHLILLTKQKRHC